MTIKLDEVEVWNCEERGLDICRYDQACELIQALIDENSKQALEINQLRNQLNAVNVAIQLGH